MNFGKGIKPKNLILALLLVCFLSVLQTASGEDSKDSQSVLEKLDDLESEYVKVKEKIGNLRKQHEDLDKKLKQSEQQIKKTLKDQGSQQKLLKKRLRESYKLSNVSGYEYMLSSHDFSDFILRSHYLKRLWDSDRKIIEAYNGGIQNIRNNQNEIVKQQKKLALLISSLNKEKQELSRRMDERKAYIAKINTEPELKKQASKEMATAKKQLSRQVASLSDKKNQKTLPKIPFTSKKGKMRCPVRARIEQKFGEVENNDAKIFHSGLDLRAKDGSSIKNPADGTVIFSGRFRGFGNMLVVDHGDKYYTLYAHLKELLWPKGQYVKEDQLIGHVGDSGSINGSYLYFELRHKGKAIDPIDWFNCK